MTMLTTAAAALASTGVSYW